MTTDDGIPRCPRCDDPVEFCDCASMSGACSLCGATCDAYDWCFGCTSFICDACDALAQDSDPEFDAHMPNPHVSADHAPRQPQAVEVAAGDTPDPVVVSSPT